VKRLLTALLAAVVLLGLLAVGFDLQASTAITGVAEAAGNLSWQLVGAAFGMYALSYVGRGLRLAVLLPGHAPLARLVSISARHNLLNLVLPLRSGEASLPLMLKGEVGRPLAEGTAALLIARILDLGAVAAWLLVGLSASTAVADRSLALPAGSLLATLLVGLLAVRPLSALAARHFHESDGRITGFIGRTAGHLADLPLQRLALAAAVSLMTWLLTYGACFALLTDMGSPTGTVGPALAGVSFVDSLVGSTALHLVGILPINTLAGIGPWEAGWTAGYVLVGVEETAALASAVVSHGAILAFVSLLGGLGWVLRGRVPVAGQPAAVENDPASP